VQIAAEAIADAFEDHRDITGDRGAMIDDPGHHLLHGGREGLGMRRIPGQRPDAADKGANSVCEATVRRIRHRQRKGMGGLAGLCHTRAIL
jgi:hypothetical protein